MLSTRPKDGTPLSQCPLNGPIHIISKIIKNIMSSAVEAEIGAGYINTSEALPIRICLEEMGQPQLPTPLAVDNTTAVGFAKKQSNSACQMPLTCIFTGCKTEKNQGQFIIY